MAAHDNSRYVKWPTFEETVETYWPKIAKHFPEGTDLEKAKAEFVAYLKRSIETLNGIDDDAR